MPSCSECILLGVPNVGTWYFGTILQNKYLREAKTPYYCKIEHAQILSPHTERVYSNGEHPFLRDAGTRARVGRKNFDAGSAAI